MTIQTIPFSNIDTAWLNMEDPTNLMMITGILLLEKPVDFERFKKTVEYRMASLSRFRMRIIRSKLPLQNPRWESDPHFDIDNHIHRIALPAPGDQKTLQELISHFMSMGLDFSRPLWQMHLIENVGQGCGVLARIHHTIGDGTALVGVMLSLMDMWPDAPLVPPQASERQKKSWNPLEAILKPTQKMLKTAQKIAGTVIQESSEAILNPSHALTLSNKALKGGLTLGKLLFMPSDPPTLFKGQLSVQKRCAWSETISLEDVKKIGKLMDAKVNDVLMTAMTGGLRRYMIKRGADVDGLDFRAAIPVNLRPIERALELGNEFALVFLALPVGIEDPHERLLTVKKRMDAIKDSPEALIAFGLLNLVGISPSQLSDQIVNLFGTKATAVLTNVPGPRMPLYFAGSAIEKLIFWVPQSGRLGLGISIFSYNGEVTLGVATDAGLVPDPESIVQGFHEEFNCLLELVRQVESDEKPKSTTHTDNLAESIAKLEALEAQLEGMEKELTTPRCHGFKKNGQPCGNRPLSGSDYCRHHHPHPLPDTDIEFLPLIPEPVELIEELASAD